MRFQMTGNMDNWRVTPAPTPLKRQSTIAVCSHARVQLIVSGWVHEVNISDESNIRIRRASTKLQREKNCKS